MVSLRGTMWIDGEHVSRSGEHDPVGQGKRCGSTAKSILSGHWFEGEVRGIGLSSGSDPDLLGNGSVLAGEGSDVHGQQERMGRGRGSTRTVNWFEGASREERMGRRGERSACHLTVVANALHM